MLCRQRSLADSVHEAPGLAGDPREPHGVSVSLGIGAASFASAPRSIDINTTSDEASSPLPDVDPNEGGGVAGAPALSAGVFLQQPLLELSGLSLHLEQHFSLLALRPLLGGEGSVLGGLAEFLVGVRWPDEPLSFAAGVTTGVARLDVGGRLIEPVHPLMLGAAVMVRYELDDLHEVPGAAFNVIARIGTLFPEGSYSDGQLAFSLGL